jgi:hypothetical protein
MGDMILGGIWYYRVEGVWGKNFSYKFLTNDGPTYMYSHHVVKSKIPMLPCVRRKGYPRFSMASKVGDSLVATTKDRQSATN